MQISTALLAPALAVAAGILAYFQWKTAHQKVVLDLFDRRIKLFYAIIESINPIMAHGAVTGPDGDDRMRQYILAARDAQFLFDDDVNDYLEELRKTLLAMQLAESMLKTPGGDYSDWVTRQSAGRHEVLQFYEKFPNLCTPYLRMAEKRVRSPLQWAADTIRESRVRSIAKPTTTEQSK